MKLIKTDGIYGLCNVHERIGNMIIGSSDHEVCNMLNYPYKLSIQNCENIFNGYDLDELTEECQNILIKDGWRESPSQKIAFTLGEPIV